MNELGNTPADKDYKPSGISKAEERAQAYENGLDYYHYTGDNPSVAYKAGYEQAEKDISALIESIIEGIIGDAQPKPILRAELQELIERIKEEQKND